jgi:type I restriction-modification system DNA methylase subunit
MLDQRGKDFIKILEHLKPSKPAYEVFSDWLVMAAATLYSWKKDDNVEQEYMNIVKQYTKEEQDKHAQLLMIITEALEGKEQDFLGEVFTFAKLYNERKGQYFTPYSISLMSAKLILDKNGFPKYRVCRINDPTCGAGGMLIAAAEVMKEHGLNYQKDALFIGQDIDARCARMAFIQLSLLGIPAIIYCMDSLSMKTFWHRETIGYHMAEMNYRLRNEAILDKIRELEKVVPDQVQEEIQPAEIELARSELVQGVLF